MDDPNTLKALIDLRAEAETIEATFKRDMLYFPPYHPRNRVPGEARQLRSR